ncbi:MAG: hypothetical protein NVS2B7_31940 [Herpetosiphon sp.]
MNIRPSTVGLILGLVLGYLWLTRGFGFAVLLGVLALLGWLVGKLVSGEINLAAIREVFTRRNG